MSAHTPAPWTYRVRRNGSISLSLGDHRIAGAAHYQGDLVGTEADARLIAAAPELLAALQSLSDALPSDESMRLEGKMPGPGLVMMRAAIAKATGDST